MIPTNLKRKAEWKSQDILFCIEQDHANGRVWFGSSDFNIYEFDVASEKPQRKAFSGQGSRQGHTSYVTGIVRAGEQLISCSYDRHLIWWDIDKCQMIRHVDAHAAWIRQLVVTPDGSRVITVADDMRCKVWEVSTGRLLASFSDHSPMTPHHYPSMLYAVAISADGRWIATGDRIGHVAIWNANTFEKTGEVEAPILYTWDPKARRHSIGGIRSLAFSADSERLAVGGIGKIANIDHLDGPARLEIFDRATGERKLDLEDNKQKGLIERIVWSPDGKWILTAGGANDGFITIYDAKSGELVHQEGQSGHIHDLALDETFDNLYVAAHERVTRWSMAESV